MYYDFKYDHLYMKKKSSLTTFLASIYDKTKNITQVLFCISWHIHGVMRFITRFDFVVFVGS